MLWWIWNRYFLLKSHLMNQKKFFVPYGFSSFNDFQLNLMALKWRPTNVPFLPSNTIDLRPAAKNARTYSPFCLDIHLQLKQNWPSLSKSKTILVLYSVEFTFLKIIILVCIKLETNRGYLKAYLLLELRCHYWNGHLLACQ